MRHYETIIIIRPGAAGEDELAAIIDKVSGVLTQDDGTIVTLDKWGIKKLAYLIDKEPQGFYLYLEYGSQPAAVKEMERQLRIDDRILKYLTVKLADNFVPPVEEEEETVAEEAGVTGGE